MSEALQPETVAYYDDPDHAASMCQLLERAHPGWHVWRDVDRSWKARHETWAGDRKPLSSTIAGLLNQQLTERGEDLS
ncbi:hypothetical protein ACIBH1_45555 [Nonomuraea sp. NPDC050663]|uniref:hypothetical protein n=1 Tax=Nonomuraea sp. NPDC050663 TaxID=3364370 RepID=UPI0037A7B0E3